MSAAAQQPQVNQKLQLQFNEFKQTIEQYTQKISALKGDLEEHVIVLDTIAKVPQERKAYRMVGGALIESNAGDVRPVLETKISGISNAVKELETERSKTLKDFEEWKQKTNVKIVKQ